MPSALFGWMPRGMGGRCRLLPLVYIIVILVLLMIILTLNFPFTSIVEKSWSRTASQWTNRKTRQQILKSHKRIDLERERKKMEQESSSIMQAMQNKMPFLGRKFVNPHPFEYIHNVPVACRGSKVELLIGIPTRTNSFALRKAIRKTWGESMNGTRNRTVTRSIFFLGTTADDYVQDEIDKEVLEYGDIVQEDFADTYRNLNLKTVALLRWVSLYCPNSTFVLKADEDMYINIPLLLTAMQEYYIWSHLFIIGQLRFDNSPIRLNESKYYLSPTEFPYNKFPSYVSGTAYAMTTTAAMKLYMESFYVPPIFLEDVYLTGVVADRAAIPKFWHKGFNAGKIKPDGCAFKKVISGHYNNATEIRKIHKELWDLKLNCTAKIPKK